MYQNHRSVNSKGINRMINNNFTDEDKYMKDEMEKMVPSYDSFMKKITLGRESTMREITVSLAGVKSGDSVLEVGCGTGTLTLAAKRRAGSSGKVYGIDLIPGMIELSQRKAAQANADITFQSGSIDDIPFSEDQFDVVMCSFMIFHMSEGVRRKGFAEIFRVLKPNGRLLIVDSALPTQPLPRAIVKMLMGTTPQHTLQELIPALDASGFSDIETAPVDFSVLGLSILAYLRANAKKVD
jgi:ubiquinone/menaquinone biosynthesis C-methylase UbiE